MIQVPRLASDLAFTIARRLRYELIIYWSKDDESFVVEVPELPGRMADG